jgi:hypothetical protein
VDPEDRRTGLAPAYELALDLEAAGLGGDELAERLGVPAEALTSLLVVAHAKAGATTDPAWKQTHPTGEGNADEGNEGQGAGGGDRRGDAVRRSGGVGHHDPATEHAVDHLGVQDQGHRTRPRR